MGSLRKSSFLIFHDPDAPTETKTLDPRNVAEIEAAHEAGKKERVDALIADFFKKQDRSLVYLAAEDPDAAKKRLKELEDSYEGQVLRWIVQSVQDLSDEDGALLNFFRSNRKMSDSGAPDRRTFARNVQEIVTSKAKLPSTQYTPQRSLQGTVRFNSDGFVVNETPKYSKWDSEEEKHVDLTEGQVVRSQGPALWVKVADGAWEKDGDWGGCLRVTCATAKNYWIAARDG
ncbi:hypothetical protein [Kitasatospora camelliae]|uniref:Uncharacterized protein n=1 Tax=Kitasatospora camelliae TaxID=3156397 RepID=A0AAU8K845_9ACTN